MSIVWIVALSVLTAVGRFLVPGHNLSLPGTYEAFAHIWVGALLVFCTDNCRCGMRKVRKRAALVCLVAITLLEAVMFLAFKRQ